MTLPVSAAEDVPASSGHSAAVAGIVAAVGIAADAPIAVAVDAADLIVAAAQATDTVIITAARAGIVDTAARHDVRN